MNHENCWSIHAFNIRNHYKPSCFSYPEWLHLWLTASHHKVQQIWKLYLPVGKIKTMKSENMILNVCHTGHCFTFQRTRMIFWCICIRMSRMHKQQKIVHVILIEQARPSVLSEWSNAAGLWVWLLFTVRYELKPNDVFRFQCDGFLASLCIAHTKSGGRYACNPLVSQK